MWRLKMLNWDKLKQKLKGNSLSTEELFKDWKILVYNKYTSLNCIKYFIANISFYIVQNKSSCIFCCHCKTKNKTAYLKSRLFFKYFFSAPRSQNENPSSELTNSVTPQSQANLDILALDIKLTIYCWITPYLSLKEYIEYSECLHSVCPKSTIVMLSDIKHRRQSVILWQAEDSFYICVEEHFTIQFLKICF